MVRQRTGVLIYSPVNGFCLPSARIETNLLATAMLGPTWVFETNVCRAFAPFQGRIIYCSSRTIALQHPFGMKCLLTIVPKSNDIFGWFMSDCRVGMVLRVHQQCLTVKSKSITFNDNQSFLPHIALIILPVTIEGQRFKSFLLKNRLTIKTMLAQVSSG